MNKKPHIGIALLYCLFLSDSQPSLSQPLFQNTYGDHVYSELHMAASPDAYYMLHNLGQPDYTPEIIKVDLNGNLLWAKTLNFISPLGFFRISYEGNTLLVTGGHQNLGYRNFLANLDTAGNVLWANELNYGDININTRIHALSNGYLTVGHRDYIGSHASYTFDITLSRFDANGNLLWAKAYGNTFYDFLANASVVTSNGELIVAGNYGTRVTDEYDPLLARFDSSGNILWMQTMEDTSGFFTYFQPTDMTSTPDGNYVLAGYSSNTNFNNDVQVMKFTGNGGILWSQRPYQIGWHEFGKSVLVDANNNIVVAGPYYMGTDYGDFFMKLDLAGNYIGTDKISKTSPSMFSSIYASHGRDLVERPGQGYVYSTYFKDSTNYSHCLITTDYNAGVNCSSLGGTYPFSIQSSTWTPTVFSNLPAAETNLTGSLVTFTASTLTASQEDICSLVGTNEPDKVNGRIYLYPNPAADFITVRTNLKMDRLVITDLAGHPIHDAQPGQEQCTVSLQNFPGGVYFITVESRAGQMHGKIVRQ
jgi:hypothetical protein